MLKSILVAFAFVASAYAHTFVHSVWVNGVDQGTGVGIRQPPYNGPPMKNDPPFDPNSSGSRSSPVRDLNAIDMICHSLGDIAVPDTIKVAPNDIVTLEWHHRTRLDTDQVIESSHKGAAAVYLSPNPPRDNSWVKIQEEGEGPKGTWYVTGKHTQRKGKQDVRIPANLAPGQYLLRSELFTLHEADVSHVQNPNRGIQLYIQCVQIEVTGSGTVKLPAGVTFPGAYKYTDPGIVYNLYSGNNNGPLYQIPGPPVWSGAAPSPPAPNYGTTKGPATQTRWSTWIGNGFSSATLRTMLTVDVGGGQTITTEYTPSWPTTYIPPTQVPTTTPPVTTPPVTTPPPSTTNPPTMNPPTTNPPTTTPPPTITPPSSGGGTVAKWGQCGGNGYSGATTCVAGSTCVKLNDWYHQCQ